jgi:hypothetical protein
MIRIHYKLLFYILIVKIMKKIIALVAGPIIAFGAIFAFVSANATVADPQRQAPVHNQGLNFQASYQNGKVQMTWNKFVPASSSWQYYKVVRSTSIQQPYYPDHGYIQAIGDQNTTNYVDGNPSA